MNIMNILKNIKYYPFEEFDNFNPKISKSSATTVDVAATVGSPLVPSSHRHV